MAAAPDRPSSLDGLVRAAAQADPGKDAFRWQGRGLSWGEVDARVDAGARGLLALGLAPGDRVALQLGNTPDFPVVYFAVLRAGLVAVPVNPGCTRPETAHVLADSRARVLVTAPAGLPVALSLRDEDGPLEHVVVAGDPGAADGAVPLEDLLAADGPPVPSPAGGEQLALVLYTSGTSGRPRGAMLTHRAMLANLAQTARIEPPMVEVDDVVLLVLPLFHVYGLNAALGQVAWHGATGVLVERFDPVRTHEEVRGE